MSSRETGYAADLPQVLANSVSTLKLLTQVISQQINTDRWTMMFAFR